MITAINHLAILAAEEGGHVEITAGDGGFWGETAWIMLVLPFVAFLAILAFGKRLKNQGGEIAVAALAINLVWAGALFLLNMTEGVLDTSHTFEIGRIGGNLVFELGWTLDGLAIMMYFLVNFVGLLVFIYALGYMKGDVRLPWFFAAFSLFAGAMLVLVAAPNLVQLIIGWEGVGLASYFLIGFYWEDLENVKAGNKAFMVNKVADVGLILGAVILGVTLGSFDFAVLDLAAVEHNEALGAVAVVAGALLFFGAMGKSAQFPLHIWLPDAMAGPTPVSALMHAATMVTAGVYLMARTFPLYQNFLVESVRPWMVAIGAITLFAIGLLALVANDIKKVLAYSTVSQLGYMMTAVAAGGYTAGLFHLFTHAFFKALLFLGAGSVIHAVHSNDMTDMGGLRKHMPTTFWTFIIGSAALAGIFPLAGFWSKDEILAVLNYEGYVAVMWIAVAGAFVTAFYMTRCVALTFFGTYKGHAHPHESPRIMAWPLIGLAIPSVLFGLFNIPGVDWPGISNFTTWLGVRVAPMGDHHPESIEITLAIIGSVAAILGVVLGWLIWGKDRDTQRERDWFKVPALYPLLRGKYYLDDVAMGIVGGTMGPVARFVNWTNTYIFDGIVNAVGGATKYLGGWVYNGLDQRGVDGVFNGLSAAADSAGSSLRKLQTGKVQQYASGFVAGALILVLLFVFVI
ncbi:MAG TPA: NADH-quinone oxidoreductase subunit L [Acidimicrobiia bacterium]|nr:NADH-quinone oxidoreductase subunit L [Acidimicrobiia bacterium]